MFKMLRKVLAIAIVIIVLNALVLPLVSGYVIAADPTLVKVNGVNIFENGVYNSEHGISGVSYVAGTNTLSLSSVSIENIYSNADLVINIDGANAINNVTGAAAIQVTGNLTIKGSDAATLNISTNDVAIEIGTGLRLTVGDEINPANKIAVNVQSGKNVNIEDTFVVDGSTFTVPGGNGGENPPPPPPPPLTTPFKLWINGALVIDETSDPEVTSATGVGYTVSKIGFIPGYSIDVDTVAAPVIGSIAMEGGSTLILGANGNLIVESNPDGYSVDCADNTSFFVSGSKGLTSIYFDGSIRTKGTVLFGDANVDMGRSAHPLLNTGIECDNFIVSSYTAKIYADGFAIAGTKSVLVEKNALLQIYAGNVATDNVGEITVAEGGKVDINYLGALGIFIPKASHWPWIKIIGTDADPQVGEYPTPTTVECAFGTSVENKYVMTSEPGHFVLESKAKAMYNLSSNIMSGDTFAADSLVVNGRVRIIAANGYKQVAPDYFDYLIEEGSTVTIELLPDYGYQYVSGGLNGTAISPDSDKGTYTFVMPAGHIHLSAIFEKVDDKINLNNTSISGAAITVPSGELNGSAEFSVNTATVTDPTSFKLLAGDSVIASYLDLSLKEVISKGAEAGEWTENITILNNKMTVTLTLSDTLKGNTDYKIIREHDGVVEVIPVVYDPVKNTLTFETDRYSTYAIAYDAPVVTTTEKLVNTGDTTLFVAISLIAMVIIANVILSRKMNRKYSKK